MDMDRRNYDVIQAEFDGLKELIAEKFDNIGENITRMDCTLKDHNGRLKLMEKIVEQGKGSWNTISGFWGIAGGAIISLIIWHFTK
jgi:hypothetical protein